MSTLCTSDESTTGIAKRSRSDDLFAEPQAAQQPPRQLRLAPFLLSHLACESRYLSEAELVSLLLSHGLVKSVAETFKAEVELLSELPFLVELDADCCTVSVVKSELERAKGISPSRMEIFDGTAMLADDIVLAKDAKLICIVEADPAIITKAGVAGKITEAGRAVTFDGGHGTALLEGCGPASTIKIEIGEEGSQVHTVAYDSMVSCRCAKPPLFKRLHLLESTSSTQVAISLISFTPPSPSFFLSPNSSLSVCAK
jgi:hypothetical protein